MATRVAIIGASGYTGAELAGFVAAHPEADLVRVFGSSRSSEGRTLASEFPKFRSQPHGDLPIEAWRADAIDDALAGIDVVFLATPHETSANVIGEIVEQFGSLDTAPLLFDLSGALRLGDAATTDRWYGFQPEQALLDEAVYALVERNRSTIETGRLFAVPGCYPTSAILPLSPLVEAGLIETARPIVISSVSGVSGAGRSASVANLFGEVSLRPYKVLGHRHLPEIALHAGLATDNVSFVPHVAPFERGIVSTIHTELAAGVSEADIHAAFETAYASSPFVRMLPTGEWPSVNAVAHTNFCDIAITTEGSRLVLCSAIDNLVKGAAGQAVQAMNVRLGLPETLGLLPNQAQAAAIGGTP